MKNLKTELPSFEAFKVAKPVTLTGGIHGTISGSRTYQGQSYIDVDWENGTSTCDMPTILDDHMGASYQDSCVGGGISR